MKQVGQNRDNANTDGKKRNTENEAFPIWNKTILDHVFRNGRHAVKAFRNEIIVGKINGKNQKFAIRFRFKKPFRIFGSVITK